MSSTATRERRGDIQGLRALAVLAVVVFHAFETVLTGGFVGVDVFFVISGFLITGILLREQTTTGRISLSGFWARRVRRLLPATIVVVIATLVVSAVRLDQFPLVRTFDNAGWALLSLANVKLANSPTGGYFENVVENPFLHFWSLAVEEQFYVVFPILLLLVGLIRWRWSAAAFIGVVVVGSLTASVLLSSANDPNAFYSLGTRAWELAIGGALAWVLTTARGQRLASASPTWLRAVLFVGGVAAIVVAALTFTPGMAWPGSAALVPTVGTALVIWAGTAGSPGPLGRILDNPVARFIGDVSFSLYLWHWPVLVLAPARFAENPLLRIAMILLAFVLAVGTYYAIERPFQHGRPRLPSWRVLAAGLPTAAAFAVVSFVAAGVAMPSSGLRVEPLAAQYHSLDQGPGVVPTAVPDNVRPSVLDVGYDLQQVYRECFRPGRYECWADGTGGDEGDPLVLVTGDSYAGMFWPSIEQAAREAGWRAVINAKAGCPMIEPTEIRPDSTADQIACEEWRAEALDRIEELQPDVILWINSMNDIDKPEELDQRESAVAAGHHLTAVAPVVMLGPTPRFPFPAERCLEAAFMSPDACTLPIEQVVRPEATEAARAITAEVGAEFLSFNGILCEDGLRCPMLVADTIMYRDTGHISNAYSTHFADVIRDVLEPYLR